MKARLRSIPWAVVSPSTTISTNPGRRRLPLRRFGGGKYLVAWNDDLTNLDVRARSLTTAGVLGTEFLVSHSTSVPGRRRRRRIGRRELHRRVDARDRRSGTMEWDVLAQRATASAVIGSEIAVADWARGQSYAFVAYDGADYLITWTDASNDIDKDATCDSDESTCWDVSARFLSAAGVLTGAPFGIVHDTGDQFASRSLGTGRITSSPGPTQTSALRSATCTAS
jgi:hypothetical protein